MKAASTRSRLEWLLVAPWRLVLLVAIGLALPLLLVNEGAVRRSEDRFADDRRAGAATAANGAADLVDVWILSLRQRIAGAANVPDLATATHSRDLNELAEILLVEIGRILPSGPLAKDVVRLTVLGADGKVISGFFGLAGLTVDPAGVDFSGTEFFQKVAGAATTVGSVDQEDVYVTDVIKASSLPALDPRTGRLLDAGAPAATADRIVLAAPIKFGLDPLVGVLVAEVDRRSVAPFLASSRGDAREVYLIDRSGRLISRAGDPGEVPRDLANLEPVIAALGGSHRTITGADPIDGTVGLIATASVPETGWITLAVRTSTEADAAADAALQQQRLSGAALALILLLGSVLIGVSTSRSIRRREALAEALEQQTATADVLKVISRSAMELREVLHEILAAAGRLCEADFGWLNETADEVPDLPIPDPDLYVGRWSRVGAFYGQTDELQQRADAVFASVKPIGELFPMYRETATSLAILDRKVVNVPDWTAHLELRASGYARAMNARSLLVVPLLREGEAIGAIALGRLTTRPFTERDVALAQTFADQAVIAIENRRLLAEIQDKSRQLEAASRHKSEFLANMSHELRTPLNAIIGFSEVLREGMFGDLNDRQREYVQDIHSSGEHQLYLINDILDLSKVEAGRMELELGEVTVAGIVDEAMLLVRERAAGHGITIAAEVSPDLPALVADGRKLKQVLLNLLTNAVKFTPDGGWVGITATRAGDEVTVSVRDTGTGIAADDQARIFEEFRQAKRRDGSVEGTGLGLALTKRIIELHGGKISIESELDKGSTFTVHLPLRQVVPTA